MILFVSIVCSITITSASAQNADSLLSNFKNSAIRRINYPEGLIKRCIATTTLLKIKTNDHAEIVDMKLSDSADPLFIIEWLSALRDIDTLSLKKFIKLKSLANMEIIMPVSYSFTSSNCTPANVAPEASSQIFYFEKAKATGHYYLLSDLDCKLKIRVDH